MNRSTLSKKSFWFASVFALVMIVLAACTPAAAPTQAAPTVAATTAPVATSAPTMAATTAPTAAATSATQAAIPSTGGMNAPTGPATVNVATDAKLGKILTDGNGKTLYIFTKDGPNQSNCTGKCLQAWPPLLTKGSPVAGTGVDTSLLGTAQLADGSTIVTYNKMPLYFWKGDSKAGDTNGQGVNKVWFVVGPDGKPVEDMSAPAATTAPAASGEGLALNVANDAKLGKILVDGKGMTLYVFSKDTPDKSNCTGNCLAAWPPFKATGDVKAGDGVDASMLGTASLADGSKIVTYNHMPLYYWKGDVKAGDTSGQGVNNVWYVVGPDGKPVGMQSSTGY